MPNQKNVTAKSIYMYYIYFITTHYIPLHLYIFIINPLPTSVRP